MKYLPKTEELLLEPSFLTFARQAYEGFIFLDEGDALHASTNGHKFTMTMNAWVKRCKSDKPTRTYAGREITFREYAGLVAQGRVRKEWRAFEKETKNMTGKTKDVATRELMAEVGKVRQIAKKMAHLEPIQNYILDTLTSIEDLYKIKPTMATSDSGNEQERIVWNAPNTLLYALILDLKQAQLENNKRCLSASYPALIKLIVDNFVDANGKPFTTKDVGTYLRQNSKRIAEKIKIDVNDRVKTPASTREKK